MATCREHLFRIQIVLAGLLPVLYMYLPPTFLEIFRRPAATKSDDLAPGNAALIQTTERPGSTHLGRAWAAQHCSSNAACRATWETLVQRGEKLFWRSPCVGKIIEDCSRASGGGTCHEKDLYQVGVFTGQSMFAISNALKKSNVPFHKFWGLDSFAGIPFEKDRSYLPTETQKLWSEGKYNAADRFGAKTFEEQTSILNYYINDERADWIRGFYNESLTGTLKMERDLREAMYIDIDCDIYMAAKQALSWFFQQKLVVPGTIIGFDDWESGGPGGEQRAHLEVLKEFNVTVKRVAGDGMAPDQGQPCFQVISIG